MKRVLKIAAVAVCAVLLLVFLAAFFWLNSGVKSAVQTVGPRMTKTAVAVNGVSLSLFSGSGKMSGIAVGNPEGYKGAHAVTVGAVSTSVRLSTIFSEPLVIESIHVDAPEVTYETGPGGNNLACIQKNIEDYCGSEGKSGRKIIIRDLRITNGKVRLSPELFMGQSVPVPLADIHLTGVGEKSGGETLSEVMTEIMGPLSKALSGPMSDLGSAAKDLGGKTMKKGLDAAKGIFGK